MTTFKGVLNCNFDYRAPDIGGGIGCGGSIHQEMFVTIYKFLSGSAGQSLGIVQRANNKGSTTDSNINYGYPRGGSASMQYWDEEAPAGQNAWAVFEFTRASPPLWLHLQFAGGDAAVGYNRFGMAPGDPAIAAQGPATGDGSRDAVAISCAFRYNGASPWNGTTASTGSDTKGTPVWNSGSVIFPRCNAYGGTRETNAEAMMRLTTYESQIYLNHASASLDANSGIFHVIASEDSLLILTDACGIGDYNIFFVGKYDPIQTAISESLNWANYVCLHVHDVVNLTGNPVIDAPNRMILPRFGDAEALAYGPRNEATQMFGPFQIGAFSVVGGGANNVYTNRAESCIIDSNFLLSDTAANTPIYFRHPNRAISDLTGRTPGKFDMFTIPISCYGDHFGYGKLGQISAFMMVFGLPSNSTINNKQFAVFGDSRLNTIKLAVPWDGISIPGAAGGREGIPF